MFYYIKLDLHKKRIPREEFHGIFLDLVENLEWSIKLKVYISAQKAEFQLYFN